jgi:hypothetical protein
MLAAGFPRRWEARYLASGFFVATVIVAASRVFR